MFYLEQIRLRRRLFFSNERQKADLKKALLSLQAASKEKEEEIIAEYLRVATNSLERILGKIDVEDVLGKYILKLLYWKVMFHVKQYN